MRQRWSIAAAAVAATLLLLSLHAAASSPVVEFRLFYRDLEVGMTEAEVLEVFDRRFPARAARGAPVRLAFGSSEDLGWSFILDPSDGRYDSEVILAEFDRGRLQAVEYHPD